jgi:SAM-dependent methyltransferase
MNLLKRAVKNSMGTLGYDIRRTTGESTNGGRFHWSKQLLEYELEDLRVIEGSITKSTTRDEAYEKLRTLALSDFGMVLFSIPNLDFPKLSALLPQMASKEVQMHWTGGSDISLLQQTVDFVRSVSYNFAKATKRTLEGAKILDFGCGYGRITRLMYYFTNEDRVYGVDPWDKSIEMCHANGLTKNFLLSEYLPSELPIPSFDFDLVFAFSVFTHLSEKAALTCLNTLTNYLKPSGVIAFTIRPVDFWTGSSPDVRERQRELHSKQGFAFLPHRTQAAPGAGFEAGVAVSTPSVDGDSIFGEASISIDWIRKSFPKLKILGLDRSVSDPLQLCIFLQKQ